MSKREGMNIVYDSTYITNENTYSNDEPLYQVIDYLINKILQDEEKENSGE